MTTRGIGGRAVMARPDGPSRAAIALDLLVLLATARRDHARAGLLPSPLGDDVLFALVSDEGPFMRPGGMEALPHRLQWRLASVRDGVRERLASGRRSFWQEMYVELRRQAGDETLPPRVRETLRRWTQRAFARSTAAASVTSSFPRQLVRKAIPLRLPPALKARAEAAAADLGIQAGARLVVLDVGTRSELIADAIGFLRDAGYTVVRMGNEPAGPVPPAGVIDVSSPPARTPLLELHLLLECDFLVCDRPDSQRLAYLTNSPCLLLNATDAFQSYPVRENGLFTLKTPVDLDTGELLGPGDVLSERYYRNLRNYGFRDTPAPEILAAVREMHEGRRAGWRDSEAQARFRARAAEAATELPPRVGRLAGRGADNGFLGDGRLARVQAERAS